MIGEQLSHYVLEAKLGEGTYGVVYRGVHTADPEIRVAVKVMQPWHVGDQKFMDSLKAECRRLDKLDHPNLVRFRELVVQGGQVAMVLELLEGQDLFDAAKAQRFSLTETVRVIESVLAGLAYAHERGVVHRDIKPGNVFLCRDGRVKILDFGIAKAAQRTDGSASTTFKGSHDYMAPERFTEAGGGPCSDVYAVGLMAWELVTGQVACVEGDLAQKLGWHIGVGPSPADVVNPRCPQWLSDLIAAMVSRDLGVRPTDAGEALVAFRAAVAGGSLEPTPFLPPTAKGPTTVALPRDEVRAAVAAMPEAAAVPTPAKVASARKAVVEAMPEAAAHVELSIPTSSTPIRPAESVSRSVILAKRRFRSGGVRLFEASSLRQLINAVSDPSLRRAWGWWPYRSVYVVLCGLMYLLLIWIQLHGLEPHSVVPIPIPVAFVIFTLHIWSILDLRRRYGALTETVPAFINLPEFSLAKAVFNPWYLHGLGRCIVDVIDPKGTP